MIVNVNGNGKDKITHPVKPYQKEIVLIMLFSAVKRN